VDNQPVVGFRSILKIDLAPLDVTCFNCKFHEIRIYFVALWTLSNNMCQSFLDPSFLLLNFWCQLCKVSFLDAHNFSSNLNLI